MGAHTIDLKQAQADLVELVDQAKRGEEVILTQDGEPVAKIIPVPSMRRRRQFGSARGQIVIREDFDAPLEEFRDYRPRSS